jgi:hypothetical protein
MDPLLKHRPYPNERHPHRRKTFPLFRIAVRREFTMARLLCQIANTTVHQPHPRQLPLITVEDWASERSYIREDKVLGSLDRLHELTAQAAN